MKKVPSIELGQCVFCVFRAQRAWTRPSPSAASRQLSSSTRPGMEHLGVLEEGESRVVGSKRTRKRIAKEDPTLPPRRARTRYWSEEKPASVKFLSINLRQGMNTSQVAAIIAGRVAVLEKSLDVSPAMETLGLNSQQFEECFRSFQKQATSEKAYPVLREILVERSILGLDAELKQRFIRCVTDSKSTQFLVEKRVDVANLRYPTEWFPATRALQRKIHLHVGPTNSGKTYHALKSLEAAKTGVYAGPLRLLAHEVYSRLNAKGKPCVLVTGEERRAPDGTKILSEHKAPMVSCTVEMTPINTDLEVAVIDEIQMIGSEDRGWAWTQALLGVKATEVHLCGEERAVPVIRYLASLMGDDLEIHHYQRLSPLAPMKTSLYGRLDLLRKGDCVVIFSRRGIHAMRKAIEKETGKKCAVIYGSLPPETRAQQARLFNDPDNDYDFLVASDAIGMGLNLSIKRIIFEKISKMIGGKNVPLAVWEIKQIGGRAGRYRAAAAVTEGATDATFRPDLSPARNVGLVTTLHSSDLTVLHDAMASNPDPITTAGITPPASIVQRFATHFPPNTPFSHILIRLHEISQTSSRFHLCSLKDQLWVADIIEPIQRLTILDKCVLCAGPASRGNETLRGMLTAFATCIAQKGGGALLDLKEVPLDLLDQEISLHKVYLEELETLHQGLTLYLWLSYRFAGVFTSRPLAFHVKSIVEEKIDKVLMNMDFGYTDELNRRKKQQEKQLLMAEASSEDGVGAELKTIYEKLVEPHMNRPKPQVPLTVSAGLEAKEPEIQLPTDLLSGLEVEKESARMEA